MLKSAAQVCKNTREARNMQKFAVQSVLKIVNNCLYHFVIRPRQCHQVQGYLGLITSILGGFLWSWLSSTSPRGARATASEAPCLGLAVVVLAAQVGGSSAARGIGFHSLEHLRRLCAPSSGRSAARVTVAEVVVVRGVIMSAAAGIFTTQSSVIRCALLDSVFGGHVGGDAGPGQLQRLSPVLNSWLHAG